MKVLVLGSTGMLGHTLVRRLAPRFEVVAVARSQAEEAASALPPGFVGITGVDAGDLQTLVSLIERQRPAVIVNCVGIVKQLAAAKDPIASTTINALLPHRLLQLCRLAGARLIHVSTDCVFSGNKGSPYVESDPPDPVDLYGMTKAIGEVTEEPGLTLRTSIIGPELRNKVGLLEWFMQQRGKDVRGYTHALYSGLTTLELARVIERLIERPEPLYGLWHVASEPISKYELLRLLNDAFGLDASIEPSDAVRCDRRLNADRFRNETGIAVPPWEEMVARLRDTMAAASTRPE